MAHQRRIEHRVDGVAVVMGALGVAPHPRPLGRYKAAAETAAVRHGWYSRRNSAGTANPITGPLKGPMFPDLSDQFVEGSEEPDGHQIEEHADHEQTAKDRQANQQPLDSQEEPEQPRLTRARK